MQKSIDSRHVEVVPTEQLHPSPGRAWWLPVFPVTHPKKGKVRLVWDSSAVFHGVSLNSELLQGPDQNNKLKGVLLRFREGEIGYMADVKSMFHSFHLNEEHRDYLRFYWYNDNDPLNGLVQYRARVHIFGNRPSPAIATLGLRHSVLAAPGASQQVQEFINHRFYVDDGLGTSNKVEEAVGTLLEAKSVLGAFHIRLHKIASNNPAVLAAFPDSEQASELVNIDIKDAPLQRTLGVAWKVDEDIFKIQVDVPERPFTRRGILSVINSLYDPLGYASPVVLTGRLLQRSLLSLPASHSAGTQSEIWDQPLPRERLTEWVEWLSSLTDLNHLKLPRRLTPAGFGSVKNRHLHVFADASPVAIGYVIYVRSVSLFDQISVSFLTGHSKVSPKNVSSIPRLELCAALEASTAACQVLEELTIEFDTITFYTDSLVVLGYLTNTERRFSRYVSGRLSAILSSWNADQWQYIRTDLNPADIATRACNPKGLAQSKWLSGPPFLWDFQSVNPSSPPPLPRALPETEKETEGLACFTTLDSPPLFLGLVSRVSSWSRQLNSVETLLRGCHAWLKRSRTRLSPTSTSVKISPSRNSARVLLIKESQAFCYGPALKTIQQGKSLSLNHSLSMLCPIVDSDGLLHVGGCLKWSLDAYETKHPILIPEKYPLHDSILAHHHAKTGHQGRHLIHASVRSAGYHSENGRGAIRNLLKNCVLCRRLRARPEEQLMADFPADRLACSPPFTHTGLDVFGPFLTQDGHTTRRTKSVHKNWVLLCTCLVSRAVHVELLPGMDTSSFRNALRRFLAMRGPCQVIRSDQGTNIMGSLGQDTNDLDLEAVQQELSAMECEWKLNPPHASHFGGSWERKIGSVRRVLEGTMCQLGPQKLSRDELATLLSEACAIVNSTPLWSISHDPNDPFPLSPSSLLNLKEDCSLPGLDSFSQADILAYGKRRWRRVQFLADQFWTRWRSQYLEALQARRKWIVPRRSLQPGDLVLLKNKAEKRMSWPLCLIQETKVSKDGLVRSVIVKRMDATSAGIAKPRFYERPISQIVLITPQESAFSGAGSVLSSKLPFDHPVTHS
ncbi:uncharacterized protein LOC131891276 [Tigriopus californicus]|nr:uncharacterized protein LOC131891276 [Tigriopus californicus]